MNTFLIPDHVTEGQIEVVLDRYWERGLTYLKGDQEDYSRIWFKDKDKVEYRVVVMYSTALLQVDETSAHLESLKNELGLRDLNQVFTDTASAQGAERFRAIMHLGCMVARNEMNEELDGRLGELWSGFLNSGEPPMVSIALGTALLLHKSEAVKAAIRKIKDQGWDPNIEELEVLWEQFKKPVQLPTRDIDRLVNRAAEALAAADFDLALESAQSAVGENHYSLQAQVLRARALDGMGDSWGAWVAMEAARTYSTNEDTSDFDGFIELHRKKIESGTVTASDASRMIALELLHSFQDDIDHVFGVFQQHDLAWKSRWTFAMHNKGMLDGLAGLLELEPDSYMVAYLKGTNAAQLGDEPAALAAWERWHNRPEFEADSFDAWALELFAKVNYAEPSISTSIFGLVEGHAENEDWSEVVTLTDFWLQVQPQAVEAWLWKGIAHTWMLDSELAIQAYDRAIIIRTDEGHSKVYFGEDPVGTAYFNRACERANNGLLDTQVFEDLAAAVGHAPRFATDATSDDYLKACWGDPRFDEALAEGLEIAHAQGRGEFGDHPDGCECDH